MAITNDEQLIRELKNIPKGWVFERSGYGWWVFADDEQYDHKNCIGNSKYLLDAIIEAKRSVKNDRK